MGGTLYDVTSCLAALSHVPSKRSLPLVQVPSRGSLSRGVCRETPPQNHKSRQYASFRNAFLFIYFLVSHTLSAMQEQARLREFCVQNYLSTSTQVFRNVAFRVPRPPPSPQQKLGQIEGLWILAGP